MHTQLFWCELASRKMISFQLKPLEERGMFLVFRKDVTLRITVDARRGNQKLLLPSPTRLASAAATSEVCCDQNDVSVLVPFISTCTSTGISTSSFY